MLMRNTPRITDQPKRSRLVSEPSDEELLQRYRDRRDQEAFQTLVHRYEQDLYRYLYRYLGDAALAEDVFQTTFLQVHLKSHQHESGRPVRPWLYAIATHQAIDALRRRGRQHAVSLDAHHLNNGEGDLDTLIDLLSAHETAPTKAVEDDERRALMRRSVAELPESLRTVVLLIYYQGLKYRDVAAILDIPVGTVKSRLHGALVKLGETWKRHHLGN